MLKYQVVGDALKPNIMEGAPVELLKGNPFWRLEGQDV